MATIQILNVITSLFNWPIIAGRRVLNLYIQINELITLTFLNLFFSEPPLSGVFKLT